VIVACIVAPMLAGWVGTVAGSFLGATGTTIVAGALTGAVASIASQGVAIAADMQDGINWKSVGMGALGGAVAAGMGTTGLSTVQQAVATSIITQGVGIATGMQKKFSWAAVAGAAVSASVTQSMTPPGDGMMAPTAGTFATGFVRGTLAGFAGSLTTDLLTPGKQDFAQIAISAIGAGVGEGWKQQKLYDQNQAGYNAKGQRFDQFDVSKTILPGSAPQMSDETRARLQDLSWAEQGRTAESSATWPEQHDQRRYPNNLRFLVDGPPAVGAGGVGSVDDASVRGPVAEKDIQTPNAPPASTPRNVPTLASDGPPAGILPNAGTVNIVGKRLTFLQSAWNALGDAANSVLDFSAKIPAPGVIGAVQALQFIHDAHVSRNSAASSGSRIEAQQSLLDTYRNIAAATIGGKIGPGDAISMAWQNTKGAYSGSQRAQGVAQVLGGTLEVGSAGAIATTGIGAPVAVVVGLHGVDNVRTGVTRIVTGEAQETLTYRGAVAITGSDRAGRHIEKAIEFVAGVATGGALVKAAAANNVKVGANSLGANGLSNRLGLHPDAWASMAGEVNMPSVMRALRQSGTTEGAAVAKLLKRGDLKVNFSDELLVNPQGGLMPYASNEMTIFKNYSGTPSQTAGLVAHEAEHFLQSLTPRQYANGPIALEKELAAYSVQRRVDSSFFLRTDQEAIEYMVKSPLYPQIDQSAANAFLQSGAKYSKRLK